jgi:hypothetical protein
VIDAGAVVRATESWNGRLAHAVAQVDGGTADGAAGWTA